MTYNELLEMSEKKKQEAIKMINKSLRGKGGFLVKAELEKDPGAAAWSFLGHWFCETLEDHLDELMESADEIDQRQITDIYMGYYDNRRDLYDILPVEAQLFAEE